MSNRNRHSAACAAGSSASTSCVTTVPLGPAGSQSALTRNRAYPTTCPSRSASTHCNGDAPSRPLCGSSNRCRSQPGFRATIPGLRATSRA